MRIVTATLLTIAIAGCKDKAADKPEDKLAPMAKVNGQQVSGDAIKGSGVKKTETRTAADFGEIDLSGAALCTVELGPTAIEISGDDNLVALVTTEVHDGALHIGMRDGSIIAPSQPFTVHVVTPALHAVNVTGSGSMVVRGVKGDAFSATTSGSAPMTLQGAVRHLDLDVTGSSNIDAKLLTTDDAKVSVTGSGKVAVSGGKTLDVSITGSGHVSYSGSPAITQHITGSGTLTAN